MPLSFQDLLAHDVEQTFLNTNEFGEWLLLKTPCGRQTRIRAVTTLRASVRMVQGDEYHVQEMTVRVSLADVPDEPELGTAARREVDASDRWFSYDGIGEGESTGMRALQFVREIPRTFGGGTIE